MNLTIDPAPDRVRLELSGRLESDAPPVVESFLIAEEFAPQLSARRFAVAYQLRRAAVQSRWICRFGRAALAIPGFKTRLSNEFNCPHGTGCR